MLERMLSEVIEQSSAAAVFLLGPANLPPNAPEV